MHEEGLLQSIWRYMRFRDLFMLSHYNDYNDHDYLPHSYTATSNRGDNHPMRSLKPSEQLLLQTTKQLDANNHTSNCSSTNNYNYYLPHNADYNHISNDCPCCCTTVQGRGICRSGHSTLNSGRRDWLLALLAQEKVRLANINPF